MPPLHLEPPSCAANCLNISELYFSVSSSVSRDSLNNLNDQFLVYNTKDNSGSIKIEIEIPPFSADLFEVILKNIDCCDVNPGSILSLDDPSNPGTSIELINTNTNEPIYVTSIDCATNEITLSSANNLANISPSPVTTYNYVWNLTTPGTGYIIGISYTTTTITEEYLSEKYPMVELEENVMINASFLPNPILVELISNLERNQAVFKGDEVIAFYTQESQEEVDFDTYEIIEFNEALESTPESVNSDAYGAGWMIKVKVSDLGEVDSLLSSDAYKELIGA